MTVFEVILITDLCEQLRKDLNPTLARRILDMCDCRLPGGSPATESQCKHPVCKFCGAEIK
jgi:hypothetical protein